MLVKVRVKDVIAETSGGLLLLISEKEIWFPKKQITKWIGNSIVVPEWLAIDKIVKYSKYTHIPPKIHPIRKQEAIDELKFDPTKGC